MELIRKSEISIPDSKTQKETIDNKIKIEKPAPENRPLQSTAKDSKTCRLQHLKCRLQQVRPQERLCMVQ